MFLLDTDALIYSFKGVPEVVQQLHRHRTKQMALSVISYGELVYGAERSARRVDNLARIQRTTELFPVIPVTRAVMDTFGRLKATLQATGTVVDDFDLVIAATALTEGYTLVTNNVRHFTAVPGLRIVNWTNLSD